jgi:hypothetical protein
LTWVNVQFFAALAGASRVTGRERKTTRYVTEDCATPEDAAQPIA